MTTETAGGRQAAEAVRDAAETLETMRQAGQEAFDAAARATTAAAAEAYDQAVAMGEVQAERAGEAYRAATRQGRDGIAAYNAAAGAMAEGFQAQAELVAAYARGATADYFELVGRCVDVRDMNDLVALQAEAASRPLDRLVRHTLEMNRIATETVEKTTAPFKARQDTDAAPEDVET